MAKIDPNYGIHQFLVSILQEGNHDLVLPVTRRNRAYESDPRRVVDLRQAMQRQTGGNASDAADEDREEVVQVVVLRNHHGNHQHLHSPIRVLEANVLDRVALDVGLLVELSTLLRVHSRHHPYLLLHHCPRILPRRLLEYGPRLDFLHSLHDGLVQRDCALGGHFHFLHLHVRERRDTVRACSCIPFQHTPDTSFVSRRRDRNSC